MSNGESVALDQGHFLDGILNPHFFSGRLLTAESLRSVQEASAAHDRQLASAFGDGVVYGLQVTIADASDSGAPVLSVSPGLGLNRNGEAVALRARDGVQVQLSPGTGSSVAAPGMFHVCGPPGSKIENPGAYVLTARPAERFEQWAEKTGFGVGNAQDACNHKYVAEGVQFHLVRIASLPSALVPLANAADAAAPAGSEPLSARASAAVSRYRSALAHWLLGSSVLSDFPARTADQPGPDRAAYGQLDALRPDHVTDCDVPLALIYWAPGGVQFVDNWSVRRMAVRKDDEVPGLWPSAGRRAADAQATFLQFHEQLQDLLAAGRAPGAATFPATVAAKDWFARLPSLGVLPVGSGRFSPNLFFAGITLRNPAPPDGPVFMEGAQLHALYRHALRVPSVDPAVTKEFLWLYRVRENVQQADATPYLVFASGHLPYFGIPRFDLSRWNLSNYPPASEPL